MNLGPLRHRPTPNPTTVSSIDRSTMRPTTLVLQARLSRLELPRGLLAARRARWRSTRAVPRPQASSQTPPVHFSDLPLDRAGHLRSQPERLDELLRSPSTQLLPFHRGKALVAPASLLSAEGPALHVHLQLGGGSSTDSSGSESSSGNGIAAATVTLQLAPCSFAAPGAQATAEGQAPKWVPLALHPSSVAASTATLDQGIIASTGYLFLGLSREGHAVFAFELAGTPTVSSSGAAPVAAAAEAEGHGGAGAAAGCQWADVRAAGHGMAGEDAAVLALATGLARWHSSAAFCSRTGAPMAAVKGGHGRAPASTASGSGRVRSVYPRVDPAVIVAAVSGDWLLLGRKKSWDAGRYSLLAGFCEVGETLEQAAVREVLEESGVELDLWSLAYHSSQPWPFPSSLMIGFVGSPRQRQHFGPPSHLLSEAGRAAAHDVRVTEAEIKEHLLPLLPEVKVAEEELEDARWFHRSFLLAALQPPAGAAQGTAQSTAQLQQGQAQGQAPGLRHCDPHYYPKFHAEGGDGIEAPFRIPGQYALANRIIWGWLQQRQASQGSQGSAYAQPSLDGAAGTGGLGSAGAAPAAMGRGAEDLEGSAAPGPWLGELLPEVSIDEGSFKYVLLRVSSGGSVGSPAHRSRLIVRGDARAGYHDHIWKATVREVRALEDAALVSAAAEAGGAGAAAEGEQQQEEEEEEGQQQQQGQAEQQRLQVETVGGGRIEHYPEQRLLSVFGYSSAFGQAPHELAAALLKKWFPFHEVVVSYDGY